MGAITLTETRHHVPIASDQSPRGTITAARRREKPMNKRRKLSRDERIAVFDKTRGHCAYCGCELRFADMQVDHVIPINGWSEQGSDTLDNMLPACRSCNHYKSRSTLEGFRRNVENMPTVLMRDSVTYRNAVRFGLVTPTPHPVRFYFEDHPPEGEED